MKLRSDDLSTPRPPGIGFNISYEPDVMGRWSERVARFFGTGRYLAIQTVIVVAWIAVNAVAVSLRWDPYPFILLNLVFSTQAAYAAPLILLAQSRQEARDRAIAERDRELSERIVADTEFVSRELAAIRLVLADVVTQADLDDIIDRVATRLRADRRDPLR